ncbi:MAG: terminase small subunit [Rhodospirillales bacterium]|nr:terminase small subunit [Rhodospirillales bacterium]
MKPLTYRQEFFCQAFVQGGNASYAAGDAGYTSGSRRQQGWRLMKTARIQDRIREIQAGMAHHHGRDHEVLLGKLENIYRGAIENHQYHAATRAIEAQARLSARMQPAAGDAALKSPAHPATSPVLVKM